MKINPVQFNFNLKETDKNKKSELYSHFVSFSSDSDSFSYRNNLERRKEAVRLQKQHKKEEAQKVFEEQTQLHPATAFMYDPELKLSEKFELISQNPNIKSSFDLARELGVRCEVVNAWNKAQALHVEHPSHSDLVREQYIDVDFEQNKVFLEMIKKKLPTSMPAGKFINMHNIKENQFREYLVKGEFVPLGTEFMSGLGIDNLLIDTSNPQNRQTLEKVHRMRPVPSVLYEKSHDYSGVHIPITVPVLYLSRLGFGDPKQLADMVVAGKLPGETKKVVKDGKEKYSVKVDIEPYVASEEVLKRLRAKNSDVSEAKDLTKKLGVKLSDIRYWMQNGDVDIINEYIFYDDYDKVFINTQTPKNKAFLEETMLRLELERELELEALSIQKAKKSAETLESRKANDSETSLRMKIAWHLCPYTRAILKEEAKGDKHLGLIISKDENDKNLTSYEQQILGSYRKKSWSKEMAKEAFSKAVNEAVAIMEQIKQEGIESIEDTEIVRIFKNHQLAYEQE